MMQLPTGGGKTVIAAHLLKGWLADGGEAVWLTHRKELVQQTRKVLVREHVRATADIWPPRQPDAPSITGGVVVLTTQTVGRRTARRDVWGAYGSGDLMVVDESHHAPAKGWQRAIEQWPGRVLAMTATPWRLAKGEGFRHLFDKLISGPQVIDMQMDGALCDATVIVPPDDQLIDGGDEVRSGDYTERGIKRANRGRDVMTAGLLRFWKEHASDRQTIVYAVSKDHARNLVSVFNDAGISAAELLSDTPEQLRSRTMAEFREGNLKVLVNLQIATEGLDLPDASCVVLARPTLSLALFMQMIGRGLRPKDEGGDCLILDLAFNSVTHGLPEDRRKWSLDPKDQLVNGEAPVVRCNECGAVSPAGRHECQNCEAPFGQVCDRCGKWRAWQRWKFEDFCGEAHQVVCDHCHNDAHELAHIPAIPELVNLPDTEVVSEMDGEIADRLKPLLRELLEMERRNAVAEDEARKDELRRVIQERECLLSNDELLDVRFESYIVELPEEKQPQNRTEKHRRYVEWEKGLKADIERWKGELDSLRNQPKERVVFYNVQLKLSGLLTRVADEIGLTVGDNLVHRATSTGLGSMTTVFTPTAGATKPGSIEDGDVLVGDVLIHRFQHGSEAQAQVVSVQQNLSDATRPSVLVNSGGKVNISLAQAANSASGNMVNAWTWWKRANR